MFELKEGQGSLFKNDKGDNPKRPDYRGELNIEGTVYELAAWIKEGKKGKFMSMTAKPALGKQAPPAKAAKPAQVSDDVPF
jgi:hypothetical protein